MQQLPSGEVLQPNEVILDSRELACGSVAVWAKSTVVTTNQRVLGRVPVLALGLVPTGHQALAYPLASIAGTDVRSRVSISRLIVAGFAGLFALALLRLGAVGVWVMTPVTLLLVLTSFQAEFAITNTGGESIAQRIAYFDRASARRLVRVITAAVAEASAAVEPRPNIQQPVIATSQPEHGPADRLGQLARLRDEGLLTPEEFETKRREEVQRL